MHNVLVTGGAGFIGSHLVERLLKEPDVDIVRVVDNLSTGRIENLSGCIDRIEFVRTGCVDPMLMRGAVKGIDVVFHLACDPSVPKSIAFPVVTHINGPDLTFQILNEARLVGVKRFIYASSSSVYGGVATPSRESDLPHPKSPYAATKLAGEAYCRAFAECYEMDTVSLRYFNVFGPRQDPDSAYGGVLAKFCSAFVEGRPVTIYGDGRQTRDFTYVDDVVSANIQAMRSGVPLGGRAFNIGTGESFNINGLVLVLNHMTRKRETPQYEDPRPGDVRDSLADIFAARMALGYEPQVSFPEGLNRTLASYKGVKV